MRKPSLADSLQAVVNAHLLLGDELLYLRREFKRHEQASARVSSLAAKLIKHKDKNVRALAASCLTQDETPKKKGRK